MACASAFPAAKRPAEPADRSVDVSSDMAMQKETLKEQRSEAMRKRRYENPYFMFAVQQKIEASGAAFADAAARRAAYLRAAAEEEEALKIKAEKAAVEKAAYDAAIGGRINTVEVWSCFVNKKNKKQFLGVFDVFSLKGVGKDALLVKNNKGLSYHARPVEENKFKYVAGDLIIEQDPKSGQLSGYSISDRL